MEWTLCRRRGSSRTEDDALLALLLELLLLLGAQLIEALALLLQLMQSLTFALLELLLLLVLLVCRTSQLAGVKIGGGLERKTLNAKNVRLLSELVFRVVD